MVTVKRFRDLAMAFPETEERPHFERASFRTRKKIFATLHEKTGIATLKFSEIDQSIFCSYNKSAIYPVPNKWGKQGWTFIELSKVPEKLVSGALSAAYDTVVNAGRKKKPGSTDK